MKHHALRALALALPGLAALPAHALVESGHWSVSPDPYGMFPDPSAIYITVDQTPGGDYTGTVFQHDALANTLTYVTSNIDEGSQLFLVRPGDALTHAGIAALPTSAGLGGRITVGEDFYLGVRTGSASDPGFSWGSPEGYTSFGWAHFKEGADGKLFIVDSAMAFREPGIVVGTLQAVPEPATWLTLFTGLLGLGWIAKHHRPRA